MFIYLAALGFSCGRGILVASCDRFCCNAETLVAACGLSSGNERTPEHAGFGSCGMQAFSSCGDGLHGARAELLNGMWNPNSLTRDRTRIPCVAMQILSQWTTREAPGRYFYYPNLWMKKLRPQVRAGVGLNPGSLAQSLVINHSLCYFLYLHAFPESGQFP